MKSSYFTGADSISQGIGRGGNRRACTAAPSRAIISGMERKKLNSSRIRSAGYDAGKQLLELEFSDGKIIAYKGVSAEIHRQLLSSPSPVSFFEDKIAENYAEARIR